MSSARIYSSFKNLFILSLFGLCVLVVLIANSCNEKKGGSPEYSQAFKPVFDSTTRLFEQNQYDKGLTYLDGSVKHMHLYTADKFRVYGFHFTANNKAKHNQVVALTYADSMLNTVAGEPDKNMYLAFYAEANFAKGDALFELGRFNEAYSSYYQGYLIGINGLNNCTLADYTYRLGMITYKQANYKFAASYFKQSFDQCQSCKTEFTVFFRQQEVLDNIAISYRNYGKTDSAMAYFNKALQFIDTNGAKYKTRNEILDVARAVVEGNMADVLSKNGQYTEAAGLLKKSIAINLKKGNDNHDAALSEIKLGHIYLNLKQYNLLVPLLKDLRTQLDSIKSSDTEAGWNLLMGTYYQNNNDFAKAYSYMENFHRLNDSLSAKSRALKENNVSDQVSNLQKHYQIIALRNQQRIYLYTGVIFLIMSTIIILLVYRNWERSRGEMEVVSKLNKQVIHQKARLERTLVDLENSSQEKDRILRTVAHDLRNPLGGIASLTNAMVDDNDYKEEQIELLKIIKETAFDTLELINEILEVTESNPGELRKQAVDINSLLSNSVELLRFKAAEKNQKIMLSTLDAPEQLMISREKIWRVISNLISNAIKFSPVGSDICVSITDENSDIQISVNDHGIGIPENIRNKVFNMFTEAKRPGTLGEKSFGLGLSICRQIIEKHHGKIWFESNTQNGTTFFVRLSKTDIPIHESIPV